MRAAYLVALAAMGLAGCGDDDQALAQNYTVHSALWTEFYATVTERYTVPDADATADGDGGAVYRLATDVWSVNNDGLAQFLSSQMGDGSAGLGVPQTVAAKTVADAELIEFKNTMARYRVFSWPDEITCDTVACSGNQGTATLQVNLNGETKSVTWPLYATGLPQGLEEMAQQIKDRI